MDADLIPDLRRAVRAHLADRPAVAQTARMIFRHVSRDFDCSVDDVEKAALFVAALGQFKQLDDPMGGSVKSYQVTAAGILAHERGE